MVSVSGNGGGGGEDMKFHGNTSVRLRLQLKGWVSSAHRCILAELDLSCATLFVPIVKEDLPILCLR